MSKKEPKHTGVNKPEQDAGQWPITDTSELEVEVRSVLESKGPDIWAVKPTDPIHAALELMAEKDIGALLVMEGEELQGIVSERDYARNFRPPMQRTLESPVREIMTEEVQVASPGDSVFEALKRMSELDIRHLPIVDQGRVVGVISIGDVVKKIIGQQDFKIGLLEQYITGGR